MLASWGRPWEAPRPLGPVLDWSWGILLYIGSYVEQYWGNLGYLGGHLGLSEALLEPSWRILDAPTRRGLPVQVHGEGAT